MRNNPIGKKFVLTKMRRSIGTLLFFSLVLFTCSTPNTSQTGNSGDNVVNVNLFLNGRFLGRLKDLLDEPGDKPKKNEPENEDETQKPPPCREDDKDTGCDRGDDWIPPGHQEPPGKRKGDEKDKDKNPEKDNKTKKKNKEGTL